MLTLTPTGNVSELIDTCVKGGGGVEGQVCMFCSCTLGLWLQVPNWSRDDLQDILSDALSQAWSPAQEAILNSETGVESVIDAVVRVSAKVMLLALLPTALHVVVIVVIIGVSSWLGAYTVIQVFDGGLCVGSVLSSLFVAMLAFIRHVLGVVSF